MAEKDINNLKKELFNLKIMKKKWSTNWYFTI